MPSVTVRKRLPVTRNVLGGGAPHDGALVEYGVTRIRMCAEERVDLLACDPRWVHIAPGHLPLDGQEWLARVVEGDGNRPIVQPIQR